MAGTIGHSGQIQNEPNVLPLIDVLLVLLIVAMLASIRHVLDVQVPPMTTARTPSPSQMVLELLPAGGFAINGQFVPDDRLEPTLEEIYRSRTVRLLFIKAAPNRKYQEVIMAADRSKGAGVQVVAFMPKE